MVQRGLNNEGGFTIVEILVAITIVTILLGIVGSVFVFVQTQVVRWQTGLNLDTEKELIIQRIFQDTQNAQAIVSTDSTVIFVDNQNREFTYRLEETALTRNNLRLVEIYDSVHITGMTISDTLNTLDIHFYYDQNIWQTKIYQSIRKPKNWEPLK